MKRGIHILATMLITCFAAYAVDLDKIELRTREARNNLRSDSHSIAQTDLKTIATELKKHLKEKPDDYRASFQLGMVYFYLEDDPAALAAFAAATELNPKDSRPWFFMGLIHRYAGQFEKAETAFKKNIEITPHDSGAWYELGVLYYNAEKDSEAVAAFEKTLEIKPDHKEAVYKLALNFMNADAAEKAYPLLSATVSGKPDNINAQYNFGQLCQNMEKTEEALTAFSRVVELDPTDWRALSKIVQLNETLGNKAERDAARKKIFTLKTDGKVASLNEEPLYVRDQFKAAGQLIMALEYFEMKGDRAIRYSFVITDETGKNKKYRITLGSYDSTNAIAQELGSVTKGNRQFHLDGYYDGGAHRTFGFFDGEPDYNDVKELVISIVKGDKKSVSATVPNRKSND